MNLKNQVTLVTGGSRGLGKAFAQGLAAAGARVVITGRSAEQLEAVAADISNSPNQVIGMAADVVDPEAAQRVVERIEADIGPISLLVNNAGMLRAIGAVGMVDPALWWREIEVNLRGPFLYATVVLPAMRARQHGRMINVASNAGLGAIPNASAYNISKTALIRLSETMAAEAKPDGIVVIAYHPGLVRTDMTGFLHDAPEMNQHLPEIQQFFRDLFAAGQDTPMAQAVQMVLQIAAGKADALSGCYLSVDHDLTALTNRFTAKSRTEELTLRLIT